MSGFVWKNVKRDIAGALASVPTLAGRSYHYAVRKVAPPAFIVDLAEEIAYHGSYGGGQSSTGRLWAARIPFTVVVGAIDAESSEDELSDYLEESGPTSVLAAVEGYRYSSCSSVTVMRAEPAVVTFASIQYLAALFSSDVVGGGA